MKGRARLIVESVGTLAVIASLVYVGVQVQQNTAAVQTSTTLAVTELTQERNAWLIENPELAELLLRVERHPAEVSAVDSMRYAAYVYQRVNLYEAIYSSTRQGTMSSEMGSTWLSGALASWVCSPWVPDLWTDRREIHIQGFVEVVDSVLAAERC